MKKITNLGKIELCPALIKSLSFAAKFLARRMRARRLYGCRSLWLNGELTSCWCVTNIWLRPYSFSRPSSSAWTVFENDSKCRILVFSINFVKGCLHSCKAEEISLQFDEFFGPKISKFKSLIFVYFLSRTCWELGHPL